MVPICVLVAWAYPISPYLLPSSSLLGDSESSGFSISYAGGFLGWRAFLGMMNPSDTINGIIFAAKLITKPIPTQPRDGGYGSIEQPQEMNPV